MSICEGCIKQDVCKFKEEMERQEFRNIPENLVCRYKKLEALYIPSIWDNTTYIPFSQTIPYPETITTEPSWELT
jgi:hypothetical protein